MLQGLDIAIILLYLTGTIVTGMLLRKKTQAYLVNDIYLKYYNSDVNVKEVKRMNYSSGIVVVLISIVLGFFVEDVKPILQWMVSALYGSYMVSNILKWHWWRFNGEGYFWRMLSGIILALLFPLLTDVLDLYYFPMILLISIAGSVIGTYTAPPTEEKTLMDFYAKTKPWSFWKPIAEKVKQRYSEFIKKNSFRRDIFNVVIGVIAQTLLVIIPLYLILHENILLIISGIGLIAYLFILRKDWSNKLENETE